MFIGNVIILFMVLVLAIFLIITLQATLGRKIFFGLVLLYSFLVFQLILFFPIGDQ